MKKKRLDIFLAESHLCESRSLAQRLIMAGKVYVNHQPATKSSDLISEIDEVIIKDPAKFVSRGGEKLEAALNFFGVNDLHGKVCVDVGSSTGGFTDCLLQRGAEKVFTVDVGYGLLHWKLRNNPRVVVMEKTNARFIQKFPDKIDFVTIDASFISLKIILPSVKKWMGMQGETIALIKPQFEAGRKIAAKGRGVIRDSKVQANVIEEITAFAWGIGYISMGYLESPILGRKGNKEYLIYLKTSNNEVISSIGD